MWNRIQLKERGKIAFQRNYWKCVLVAFVMMIALGGSSAVSSGTIRQRFDINYTINDNGHVFGYYSEHGSHTYGVPLIVYIMIFMTVLMIAVISALVNILICMPIEVGGCRFFMENTSYPSSPDRLGYAFKKGFYGKVVLTLFLRQLYIFLWTLLFIVPGFIKAYEYRLVPYLLADDPNMPRQDAFRISREMMDGNKWAAFVLDLSFFGWEILSACTCGILGIFYVNPYVYATNTELFLELKNQYFWRQNQGNGFM